MSQARFAKHDRARRAELIAEGRKTASILIAYHSGQGARLLKRLTALGGHVRYQADSVGYLRVDLSTARVLEAAALPGIEAININGTQVYGASIRPETPRPQAVRLSMVPSPPGVPASLGWQVAPPDASIPRENPYLPTRDVGAPQFVAAHPTFDGRGVTIGAIECCPDFRHPVFQEPALTLDGRPTRKLAALYIVVANDSEATNRVNACEWVAAVNGRFTYDGATYRAPRDGRFRIGYYFGSTSYRASTQRLADTVRAPTQRRAVLLDPQTREVWVDVLANRDFTSGGPLRGYNESGDVGAFGRDDPATPWDDRLTFAIDIDSLGEVVDVYPGDNAHITSAAGVAVGTRFYGSAASGAAPHARMVFVSEGGGWQSSASYESSHIEAMILLAQIPDVDIITTQDWYDLRLKDGSSVWSIIADRLVTSYHKLLFQAAGNEFNGLGSIYEAVNGERVVKVGGSIDHDTWYTIFALLADRKDYVFRNSSAGPRADGRAAPDVVAPEVGLEATPIGSSNDSLARYNTGAFSSKVIYRNPPGYSQQFGTSYATPTAAGAAALVISAARQRGTPADPARVRWALLAGARYFSEYEIYQQGTGLLNVSGAWDRLRRASAPVQIIVDAPVRTGMSPYLRVPGRGRGLYERDGWTAGDSATRLVTVTRTSGPGGSLTYELRWLGNDGTFAAPHSVQLGLDQPVTVPVGVHPRTWGAHSALLQLVGEYGLTLTQRISAVVVAAHALDAAHQYTFVDRGRVEWLSKTSYFVSVPPSAAALNLSLVIDHGAVMLAVFDPTGGAYPSAAPVLHGRHYGWPDDIAVGYTVQRSRGAILRTIEDPEPGVWEVVVLHEGSATPELRLKRQTVATFTFRASVTRMMADAAQTKTAETRSAAIASLTLAVRNRFAATTARLVGGIASVAREEMTFSRGDSSVVRELTVDSGTTRLGVQLSRPSDPAADIDVHIFDCTGSRCDRHVSAVFLGAEKELLVQNPRPGRWRIVIDPYTVPSGTTSVEYQDEIVHPKFGTAKVLQPVVQLRSNETVPATVLTRFGVPPGPGRTRELRVEGESLDDQTPSAPAPWGPRYPRGVLGVIRTDLPNR